MSKKQKKVEMLAQSSFSADGPALFMDSDRVKVRANWRPLRLWPQPQEVLERVSKRILRLRQGKVPKATTKAR